MCELINGRANLVEFQEFNLIYNLRKCPQRKVGKASELFMNSSSGRDWREAKQSNIFYLLASESDESWQTRDNSISGAHGERIQSVCQSVPGVKQFFSWNWWCCWCLKKFVSLLAGGGKLVSLAACGGCLRDHNSAFGRRWITVAVLLQTYKLPHLYLC